jgi:lactate dehydrogenase-like 2-hydroxyacid dehydrogenase
MTRTLKYAAESSVTTPLVLVTEPEFRRAERVFSTVSDLHCRPVPSGEKELAAAIQETGVRHVVVGGVIYRDALYASLPKGGVLARFGVGFDGLDLVKATAAGLLCTNTPDVLTQSTAELAILLMMASARRLIALDTAVRQSGWRASEGTELFGKTLAVVGCGRIGRATARIASTAFQMRVIGYRRRSHDTRPVEHSSSFDAETDDFATAVRTADFVTLHIPASPENAHFIDRERVQMMQTHAWLINTARGSVVDEVALYNALVEGRLGGAALDVFEREPYVPVDPARDLRTLTNVVLTPHVGSHTADANRQMAERALQNIRLAQTGDFSTMDLINPEVLNLTP